MLRKIGLSLCFAFAMALEPSAPVFARNQPPITPAPIPTPILTAKKVFISNAGGDGDPFGDMGYSGGPDRSYNQFYSFVNAWGRYELVSDPASADLVFEIGFSIGAVRDFPENLFGTQVKLVDPRFKLVIRDARTHFPLWVFTQHVELARSQGNRDKNFDQALAGLVEDLKRLAERTASAQSH